MLAYMSAEELAATIRISPMHARTVNTITDFGVLVRELTEVRQQGFAVDNAAGSLNQYCLSAPIWSQDGSLVASISVMRREMESVLLIKEELLRCAERISHVV
ncbi:DNA-binding IclR family transcriptional regulator [Rhizobium tibeticum]|nr:DNA-binding IclR family transcriptional regulator [Rhizobium tibeticum]